MSIVTQRRFIMAAKKKAKSKRPLPPWLVKGADKGADKAKKKKSKK